MQVHKSRAGGSALVALALIGSLLGGLPAAHAEEDVATFRAQLIHASDQPAAQDPRLDRIEYQLRRMFRFEYYKWMGEGSAAVRLPGVTALDLGSGFRLNLSAADAGKGRVRATVQWLRGSDSLLNTTVVMNRGAPVVLGGISHEGGTLIVSLTVE